MWQLAQDYTLIKIVKYSSGIKLDWGPMVPLWSRVVMRFPPNDRKINQRDDEQKKGENTQWSVCALEVGLFFRPLRV